MDKFKNLESKNSILKNIIIDSIGKILRISINKKDVEIKNGVIYLKVNPVVRNEMFINKVDIIKELDAKNIAVKGIF